MKKLGIIGGLGPMATAYFFQLLTQMSDVSTDQEHMEIYIISRPSTPDRTKYIVGESQYSPLPQMIDMGRKLKALGAELLVIPCITAHYFHDELEVKTGLRIVNAIEETADYLDSRGVKHVGIMATTGTLKSKLFQEALEHRKMNSVIPSNETQKMLMELIYKSIKAGEKPNFKIFGKISDELKENGAQVILLACTELSLIKKDFPLKAGYLDVMEVLAAKTVQECNYLNSRYHELITR